MKLRLQQIEYMSQFKCIGADCPDSCCHQWSIYVNDEEHHGIEQAFQQCGSAPDYRSGFVRDEDGNRVLAMTGEGRKCHFMDEGMCSIHAQFGHHVLPKTCQTYPRSYAKLGNVVRLAGYTSCPVVAGLLLESDDQCEIDASLKVDETTLSGTAFTYVQSGTEGILKEVIRFDAFLYKLFWGPFQRLPLEGLLHMSSTADALQRGLQNGQVNERQVGVFLSSVLERVEKGMGAPVPDGRQYETIVSHFFADVFQYLIKNYAYHTYYKFLYETLMSYHGKVNAGVPFDSEGVSFTSDGLFRAFQNSLDRIWDQHGVLLRRCLGNYIRHHLFKFTIIRHSDLVLYTRRLLAILWVYTILIVGHPSLAEEQGDVDEEGVKQALKGAIYIASRFIEHTAMIADIEAKLSHYGFTDLEGLYALIWGLAPKGGLQDG